MTTMSSTATTIPIIFEYSDGEVVEIQAEVGKNYLHVAQANGIDLEGACGGELACATCHLIFDPAVYDTLPPKAEEEEDMLDLAYGLTKT
jgi:ferredoxin